MVGENFTVIHDGHLENKSNEEYQVLDTWSQQDEKSGYESFETMVVFTYNGHYVLDVLSTRIAKVIAKPVSSPDWGEHQFLVTQVHTGDKNADKEVARIVYSIDHLNSLVILHTYLEGGWTLQQGEFLEPKLDMVILRLHILLRTLNDMWRGLLAHISTNLIDVMNTLRNICSVAFETTIVVVWYVKCFVVLMMDRWATCPFLNEDKNLMRKDIMKDSVGQSTYDAGCLDAYRRSRMNRWLYKVRYGYCSDADLLAAGGEILRAVIAFGLMVDSCVDMASWMDYLIYSLILADRDLVGSVYLNHGVVLMQSCAFALLNYLPVKVTLFLKGLSVRVLFWNLDERNIQGLFEVLDINCGYADVIIKDMILSAKKGFSTTCLLVGGFYVGFQKIATGIQLMKVGRMCYAQQEARYAWITDGEWMLLQGKNGGS